MSEQNQAMFYRPTLLERLWRKAGYCYHVGDDPEGSDLLQGWMRTDMRMHFGWADRLRLLLTGNLFIACIVTTDTPSPTICNSRMDWKIVHPGGNWR